MEVIDIRDRQVQYPNRFRATPVSGQEDVYDLTAVPGTVTQAGTALNKANLLSDATAALLGLSGDPSVNDALAFLGDAVLNPSWKRIGSATLDLDDRISAVTIPLTDYLDSFKWVYIYDPTHSYTSGGSGDGTSGAGCYYKMGASGIGGDIYTKSGNGTTDTRIATITPILPDSDNCRVFTVVANPTSGSFSSFGGGDEGYHYNSLYFYQRKSGDVFGTGEIEVWGMK